MSIKAIGFDQGGVLIDVDYDETVRSFEKLGVTNADQVYSKANQTDYIDKFEQGKIDTPTFRQLLRDNLLGLKTSVTDQDLDFAWNAMVLDFKADRLEFALELRRNGFVTFIFSNIDDIHYARVVEAIKRDGVRTLLDDAFDEKYFSHLFGCNKPSAASFRKLAAELKTKYDIKPEEILFIDDSAKHICGRDGHEDEGALCAGWQGLLVQSNLTATALRESVTKKLECDS